MPQLHTGLQVQASDGEAGKVIDILLDADSGQPVYLVVTAGFFKADHLVACSSIASFDEQRVWLNLTRAEVSSSPQVNSVRQSVKPALISMAAQQYGDE